MTFDHGQLPRKIFILSPARTTGKRAALILNPASELPLARRLRTSAGVPLGEVFSFCSSLYFRGKVTYAERFAVAPADLAPAYVITSSNGLVSSRLRITATTVERFAGVPIDPAEATLSRAALSVRRELQGQLSSDTQVILLGSIATPKYVDPLIECFGDQLFFPTDFVGRGDMSRGGLLLRAVAANRELAYQQLSGTLKRTGSRPPKLSRDSSGTNKRWLGRFTSAAQAGVSARSTSAVPSNWNASGALRCPVQLRGD